MTNLYIYTDTRFLWRLWKPRFVHWCIESHVARVPGYGSKRLCHTIGKVYRWVSNQMSSAWKVPWKKDNQKKVEAIYVSGGLGGLGGWVVGWLIRLVLFFSDFCLWVGFVIAGWLLMKLYHSLLWFLDRVALEQRRLWRWRQGSPWYQGFPWQERSPPWFSIRQAPSPSLAWTWQQCGSTSYEFMKYIRLRYWTPTEFF